MKRFMNTALLYAILAMVGGVFYREFTKFFGFTAKTTLSVVHVHYFMLGTVFFLRAQKRHLYAGSGSCGRSDDGGARTSQ